MIRLIIGYGWVRGNEGYKKHEGDLTREEGHFDISYVILRLSRDNPWPNL